MGNFLGIPAGTGAQDVPMFYTLDVGPGQVEAKVKIPTLRQLGLGEGGFPWAWEPRLWTDKLAAGIRHSLDQYPYAQGDSKTLDGIYQGTPLFSGCDLPGGAHVDGIFNDPAQMLLGILRANGII